MLFEILPDVASNNAYMCYVSSLCLHLRLAFFDLLVTRTVLNTRLRIELRFELLERKRDRVLNTAFP